jgi:GNAT superfamily N-acetyltransferase
VTSLRIAKLAPQHAVAGFDSGQPALDRYLVRHAWANQHAQAAQTYVGLADDVIIGFYTLVVGEVRCENAPERLSKGLARHAVPLMLLARLAVSRTWQGRGVGAYFGERDRSFRSS